MKNIGFKNFRRFDELDSLELGEITFLVGRNNSGKSTLVKAILLVIDYLKNRQAGVFPFDGKSLNDANVVSFKRTLYNKAKQDLIQFSFTLRNFDCVISITGDDNDTKATVQSMNLKSHVDGFEFNFNFVGNTLVTISRTFEKDDLKDENILEAEKELDRLKSVIDKLDKKYDLQEYIKQNDLLKAQKKRIKEYKSAQSINHRDYVITYALPKLNEELEPLDGIINEVIRINKVKKNDRTIKGAENIHPIQSLYNDESLIRNKIEVFVNHFSRLDLAYFGADSIKQTALFSLKDKDNSLAQVIHKFHQLKLAPDDELNDFVRNWMVEFEIGDDYSLKNYEGEVYRMRIFEKDPQKEFPMNLSDKGMGSLQAMKLILQIVTVISYLRDSADKRSNEILIVEEPELNLHPALQSKLANLFYAVNRDYGIKFIIETHSEYILRNSQLIVKSIKSSNELNQIPFSTYYFDKEKGPYPMQYRNDGVFIESFGTGFFDVASQSAIKLLRKR